MEQVFVVVLNWNGLQDTRACLQSLRRSSHRPFRIVLVDNGSRQSEGTTLKREFDEVHLIENEQNLGFCEGNNVGIRYALCQSDCRWVLLLNNDVVVEEKTTAKLAQYADLHPRTLVSPCVLFSGTRMIQTMGGRVHWLLGATTNLWKNRRYRSDLPSQHPDFLSGCALLAPRELFEQGVWSDSCYFSYFEDVDLGLRARALGFALTSIAGSVAFHGSRGRRSMRSPTRTYLVMRNSLIFARKHLPSWRRWLFSINAIAVQFGVGLWRFRSPGFIPHWWHGVMDGLQGRLRLPESGA